ncbi:MAG: restriction endonuclease, partial [Pseudomonadota bacterium]
MSDQDVSEGRVADDAEFLERVFPEDVVDKFEIFSYRNAASILANGFPDHFSELIRILRDFSISTE